MKLLVPIDNSQQTYDTLLWATQTFNPQHTEFLVFHVVQLVPEAYSNHYHDETAQKIVKDAEAFLIEAGFNVSRSDYGIGDPVDLICQHAKEQNVETIVMGSHGNTGWVKFFLGSTSQGVLANSEKPVIIYRNANPAGKPVTAHTASPEKARK